MKKTIITGLTCLLILTTFVGVHDGGSVIIIHPPIGATI
jgi:hypothetical protein